jgi:hypothetical protein
MLRPLLALILICAPIAMAETPAADRATTDDGSWFVLPASETQLGAHHLRHAEVFCKYVTGYNRAILAGIDRVQLTQPQGGGYFTGVKAQPAESPIGYEIKLSGSALLSPPRTTSYCSGSSYCAFVEGVNLILPDAHPSPERIEAMRMQEPDGGRREDGVKMWGHWNEDGFGTQFALVQYTGAGTEIKPNQLRPGDFLNISWKSGLGHSVVFLGFYKDDAKGDAGAKQILFWSSQKGTNGLGDSMASLDRIAEVKCVRLTNPEKLLTFDPTTKVSHKVPGDKIDW